MVAHTEALEKTCAALKAVGWDEEGARVQAEIMVSSEACGNNQGAAAARASARAFAGRLDGARSSLRARRDRAFDT